MDQEENNEATVSVPRRVPALIVYLRPFRMIQSDAIDNWSATIQEVNSRRWDYVKLHEIVGGIDVGLEAPYHMLVGRDGALALPPIPKLRDDREVVEFFNRCLAALIIGGVYCEAVSLDHLEIGSVIDWKYLRTHGHGQAASNRFHLLIRQRQASPLEAIELLAPRTETFHSLQAAMNVGLAALADVPPLSGEFLLKGVSGIARRDWGAALTNLWIVIEQITMFLWEREVLKTVAGDSRRIDGRLEQLKDARTWTTASRQEMLHQKGVVETDTLRNLFVARKCRNELMHRGVHASEAAAQAAYSAVLSLLQIALARISPLSAINLSDHSLSDPFKPVDKGPLEPKYWMAIPKLPGEEALEREEARVHRPGRT